jgi:hypothetical protein
MDDTIDPREQEECNGPEARSDDPLSCLSTDELEKDLFNEIQFTSSACDGDMEACAEIDEDLGGEQDCEDDDERRCSVLRVLATMRS